MIKNKATAHYNDWIMRNFDNCSSDVIDDHVSGKKILVTVFGTTITAVIGTFPTKVNDLSYDDDLFSDKKEHMIISFNKVCPPDIAVKLYKAASYHWNVSIGDPFVAEKGNLKFEASRYELEETPEETEEIHDDSEYLN